MHALILLLLNTLCFAQPLIDNRGFLPARWHNSGFPQGDDHYNALNFAKVMFAVILPNTANLGAPLAHFAVSVDEIERSTGLDLFASLEDDEESQLESTSLPLPLQARSRAWQVPPAASMAVTAPKGRKLHVEFAYPPEQTARALCRYSAILGLVAETAGS